MGLDSKVTVNKRDRVVAASLTGQSRRSASITAPAVRAGRKSSSGVWLQRFILLGIALQLLLAFLDLLTGMSGVGNTLARIIIRTGAFGASLVLLFLISGRGVRHPAKGPAVAVLVIMGVSLLHPTTNSLLSGTAQATLYLAILAPLFWVTKLRIDVSVFRRAVMILWGFHTLSAFVGILQVTFPGYLQPSVSAAIIAQGEVYVEGLKITTATGQRVFRPMGLTDSPGGAAGAGFYAILFGVGLLLTTSRGWIKLASLLSMALGLTVIYLSQVRVALVVTVICVLVFSAVLALQGRVKKLAVLAPVAAGVAVLSFLWAVMLGGESVTKRLATLTEDRASDVYQSNRGHFLEHTFTEHLPQYPLGAGLGRWGMMNNYFGDNSDPDRAMMWVEIMWTGWLYDGGIPLMIAYVLAILAALWTSWRIAGHQYRSGGDDMKIWGALFVGYNIGVIATLFNGTLFIGSGGTEFWLLNAALFTAACYERGAESRDLGSPGLARPMEPGVHLAHYPHLKPAVGPPTLQ